MLRVPTLVALVFFALSTTARAADQVFVINLPEVQKIEGRIDADGPVAISGSVEIDGPIPQGKFVPIPERVVTPVSPDDTPNLVFAGHIEASGFTSVVLSLAGEIRSNTFSAGGVGALLIPDEPSIVRAFVESGQALFPLQVAADALASADYFASDQPRYAIGFPRYRVYFYNTTDGPASVRLFAYLGN